MWIKIPDRQHTDFNYTALKGMFVCLLRISIVFLSIVYFRLLAIDIFKCSVKRRLFRLFWKRTFNVLTSQNKYSAS